MAWFLKQKLLCSVKTGTFREVIASSRLRDNSRLVGLGPCHIPLFQLAAWEGGARGEGRFEPPLPGPPGEPQTVSPRLYEGPPLLTTCCPPHGGKKGETARNPVQEYFFFWYTIFSTQSRGQFDSLRMIAKNCALVVVSQFFLVTLLSSVGLSATPPATDQSHLSDYVRPFVGTQGEGNTYPGPSAPFGMIQLSPDTEKELWETASGYEYSDPSIMGFSLTHLTGTGIPDLGDFLFVPQIGAPKFLSGIKK